MTEISSSKTMVKYVVIYPYAAYSIGLLKTETLF